MDQIEDCLSFYLGKAYQRVTQSAKQRLAPYGVTPVQYAALLAIENGYQAALMAPTEILARQHLQTLATALAASKVRLALLTGSLTQVERRETLDKIAAGEVDVVIGTQASPARRSVSTSK